jgi:hypothetical protein
VSAPNTDRAAVVTTSILLVTRRALRGWLHRDRVDLAAVRAEIEAMLRDEFTNIAQTTRDEIRESE